MNEVVEHKNAIVLVYICEIVKIFLAGTDVMQLPVLSTLQSHLFFLIR